MTSNGTAARRSIRNQVRRSWRRTTERSPTGPPAYDDWPREAHNHIGGK